jgi:pyruvate dehydrogenase E1 component alpha subunit/2-oxoisovalerate dehydrogenase E1 component alpha subunit
VIEPHARSRAAAASAPPARMPDYFGGDDHAKATGLFGVLAEDGAVDEAALGGVDAALARDLHRGMLTIRIMDERLLALQRQGRIGFYGEARGQEAAVVGSAAATEPADWLVPALREAGAGIYRGMPLAVYVAQIFGNAEDISKGRQMPCHPCHRDTRYVVMSSCVASQLPHAVGIAWGMKLRGDRGAICVGYMGDGGTSEGDFHVALNFAGVARAPVVLICQNNQWAISTPGALQTAAETYAVKGLGYGIESLRVDGNDVLAVYLATRYAADKARRGDGPTFLELLTYRVSAHSSSDDPSRYRDESVTEVWRTRRDPVQRMRAFLAARGWLSEADERNMAEAIEAEVRDAIAAAEPVGPPPLASLIEDVFEAPTWLLREQLAELEAHVGAGGKSWPKHG